MSVQTPLTLKPNKKLMRSARICRLGFAAVLLALAVLESDPIGRALAGFAAFMFVVMALLVPRAGRLYLVATEAGLENNYFGLITWDEIAALRVRQRRRGRALEIYDRDRKAMVRRARPRLLQVWMYLTQPFHLPLLRITEQMASFDADHFRGQLERLAGRTFPERWKD